MNIYILNFEVNHSEDDPVRYRWTVESEDRPQSLTALRTAIESLTADATHEEIADSFYRQFRGKQTLVSRRDDVRIETLRACIGDCAFLPA